jgi:hypothetical protein
LKLKGKTEIFTRVGTTCNAGLSFALLLLLVVLVADTLIKILHYCPISPCFQD